MGNVTEIVDLAEKLIERRMPLQVNCLFEGSAPPTFFVVITNVSKGEPVAVKEVRVHFGMKSYTYASTDPSETPDPSDVPAQRGVSEASQETGRKENMLRIIHIVSTLQTQLPKT